MQWGKQAYSWEQYNQKKLAANRHWWSMSVRWNHRGLFTVEIIKKTLCRNKRRKIRIWLCEDLCIDYMNMKTPDSRSGHERIGSMTNCKKVNKEKTMANTVGVWEGYRLCLINGSWIWTHPFTMSENLSQREKVPTLTLSFQLNGPPYSRTLFRVGLHLHMHL